MNTVPFIAEFAVEEIPASYIQPALIFLQKSLGEYLVERGVNHEPLQIGATPRRFVIFSTSMTTDSISFVEEIKGPPVNAAYDKQGEPTQTLHKFLSSNNIGPEATFEKKMEKGIYIFAKRSRYFGDTATILADFLTEIVPKIPTPKKMHWIPGNHLAFARPVRNIMMYLGDKQITNENFGVKTDNSLLPRFYYLEPKQTITGYADYFAFLNRENIIIDIQARKNFISEQLRETANTMKAVLVEDEDLLDTVTNLVETPFVGVGTFDEEFLEVPDCVLISVMKDHQKYFSLRDQAGRIKNNFLFIANQKITNHIIKGNERVIRARFKDAQFFFREDKSKNLSELATKLDSILFTRETGSLLEKGARVLKILKELTAPFELSHEESLSAAEAARIAKADQLTRLVFEFPELEGQIGSILAQHQGYAPTVATAIQEQYFPKVSGGPLPVTKVGAVLACAEKVDSLTVLFATGKIPTGSADPYALRRLTIGILEIFLARKINIDLNRLFEKAAHFLFEDKKIAIKESAFIKSSLLPFVQGRFRTVLENKGFSYDEIDAYLAIGELNIFKATLLLHDFREFRKKPELLNLLQSSKRIQNLLHAAQKKGDLSHDSVHPDLFKETEEQNLWSQYQKLQQPLQESFSGWKFLQYFEILTQIQPAIDTFFEKIMVMSEDQTIRKNRLALLRDLANSFNRLLVLEKIQV